MDLLKIKSPADIRKMSVDELKELASAMRDALITKLSRHGGHCGPNLGVVEATIAMHYVFNTPDDKIVYDVSHQCYPHKMLTGRMEAFVNPDDYDSVSGFTNPDESPEYDMFCIGHTSTGASMATGLAKARDLRGGHENIIAFIGDGALSGGEAYEGLDYAATLGSNFIAVINDNQMSIAPNHGGIYANLDQLRESNGTAACNMFKALGFDYVYVADGNDLEALIAAFRRVKDTPRPTVVHINTQKGEGYAPAEADREEFHFTAPFDRRTGALLSVDPGDDFGSITRNYLLNAMKSDPMVVAISAGTPGATGFDAASRREAGKQFVDVGIAEQDAASMASGLAKAGARPVWLVVSSFMQRAYDQISQDLAINREPAVIDVFYSSIFAMNDVTHLGIFDIPFLSNIPGLTYLAPTCADEYLAMLDWAMRQSAGPVAVRVPVAPVVTSSRKYPDDYSTVSSSVERRGSRAAIIGVGNFLDRALEAADILHRQYNIDVTVINPRFLNALDTPLLDGLKADHSVVMTLEDGIIDGGFGQKVAAHFGDTPMRVICRGYAKEFIDRYDARTIVSRARLDPGQIATDIAAAL